MYPRWATGSSTHAPGCGSRTSRAWFAVGSPGYTYLSCMVKPGSIPIVCNDLWNVMVAKLWHVLKRHLLYEQEIVKRSSRDRKMIYLIDVWVMPPATCRRVRRTTDGGRRWRSGRRRHRQRKRWRRAGAWRTSGLWRHFLVHALSRMSYVTINRNYTFPLDTLLGWAGFFIIFDMMKRGAWMSILVLVYFAGRHWLVTHQSSTHY